MDDLGTLGVAAGTAFFHGTYRAPAVVRHGVRASNATPGGSALTGFAWFFASHAPAQGYCICDPERDCPAVVEFAIDGDMRLADFRERPRPTFAEEGVPWTDRLKRAGFDGVVIENTASARDYEYGFLDPTRLNFVRYWSPSRYDLLREWAWERYCELGRPETDALHVTVDRSVTDIEMRIRSALT